MTWLTTSLVLGLRHAFEPDHIATLAALRARARGWPALRLAMWWSLGHAATLLGLGMVAVGFGRMLPPIWQAVAELLVAGSMVALGLRGLWLAGHAEASGLRTSAAPWALGVLHGLAGSGTLVLLLTSASLRPGRRGGFCWPIA